MDLIEQFARSTVDYYGPRRAVLEAPAKKYAFESQEDMAAYVQRVTELARVCSNCGSAAETPHTTSCAYAYQGTV